MQHKLFNKAEVAYLVTFCNMVRDLCYMDGSRWLTTAPQGLEFTSRSHTRVGHYRGNTTVFQHRRLPWSLSQQLHNHGVYLHCRPYSLIKLYLLWLRNVSGLWLRDPRPRSYARWVLRRKDIAGNVKADQLARIGLDALYRTSSRRFLKGTSEDHHRMVLTRTLVEWSGLHWLQQPRIADYICGKF